MASSLGPEMGRRIAPWEDSAVGLRDDEQYHPTTMACHACSEPVPVGARFCPSCGAPQLAMPEKATDDERRVVTVLFADIVGFTRLAERRDPEQVKRLIESVFERLVGVVEAHGGVVDKVLGDAIVALFGAPVAHEDDAERAVRAGLAMQAVLADVRADDPADAVEMRIGVNTGEVLVGTLAGTDYTAMGDVVNTASRLQDLAPAGSVLVGDATRQLCSAVVHFCEFEAVQLRGRDQETRVWLAEGVDTAAATRRWSSDVVFVGRRAELGMMAAVVSTVLAGRGAIVAVSGEPGIGKSRLVSEALDPVLATHPDALVLEGACAPYGEPNVWWPLAGGILRDIGLDRSGTPAEVRERIRRRLPQLAALEDPTADAIADAEQRIELVMHLLGQPSALDELGPGAIRDTVVSRIVHVLRKRAERTPVIIWLDDLQWAAPILLELLETLARQLAGLPVLTIVTYRPFDDEAEAEWPPSIDPALTLHLRLEPLDESASEALVAEAGGSELHADIVQRIIARSGGNPLFLIELARLAADGEGRDGAMPGSLRALIAARLDQLTVTQRAMLDNAAIIGNQGRVSSLRRFATELGQTFDPADLDALVDEGLMVRERAAWRFRSDVVREVAYHTLTKQARAARHAGVARYLATYEPGAVDRRAHHSAAAAELQAELGPIPGVPVDIADEAVQLLGEAGQRWNHQGAHRRALQTIERALALHGEGDPVDRNLRLQHVETLANLRVGRRARMLVHELLADAVEVDDRVVLGEALRVLGTIEQADGDLVAARRSLGDAVGIFRELGDRPRLAEALRARGFAEVFGGSLADAEWFLGEAESLFAEAGNRRGQAWVQQHQAWVSFLAGDHDLSERRLRAAVATFEELGDREGRSWSLGLLAYGHHFARRNGAALELAAEVLGDARRWGDEWGAAMMLNLQAAIHLWRDDVDEARALAERALAGFRRIDDRFGTIQVLGTVSRASAALGRFADVERTVEEVLALSDAFGELAYPSLAAAGAALHVGNGPRAVEHATNAIARLDTTGANVDEGRVALAFGHLLGGDVDAALATLLEVEVAASPYALAARATALASIGDRRAALEDVRAVETMAASGIEISYWDRAMASIAGVAAATGDEAVSRAEAVRDIVRHVQDVVVTNYAASVLQRLGHECDAPVRSVVIGGWADVAALLASA
jgi:class 3 adenylate cyclase/tetratricopeptide (TPR) repeat protein